MQEYLLLPSVVFIYFNLLSINTVTVRGWSLCLSLQPPLINIRWGDEAVKWNLQCVKKVDVFIFELCMDIKWNSISIWMQEQMLSYPRTLMSSTPVVFFLLTQSVLNVVEKLLCYVKAEWGQPHSIMSFTAPRTCLKSENNLCVNVCKEYIRDKSGHLINIKAMSSRTRYSPHCAAMEGVLRSKVQTVDVKHHQFLAQLRNLVQNKFFIAGWTHVDIYQGDFL